MSRFSKAFSFSFLVTIVCFCAASEANAGPVSLTLTPTTYDLAGNSFTVTGFITNSGNLTFRANDVHLVIPPDLDLVITASNENGEAIYARPVPPLSSTAVLPLLDWRFLTPVPPGTYTFSVAFSGFDSSGAAIRTDPVAFTLRVSSGQGDPVPEPATVFLLTTGLALTAAIRRRRSLSTTK